MNNNPQSPLSEEQPDRSVPQVDIDPPVRLNSEQAQLDALMVKGFSQDEAARLVYVREHLYSNAEMRQRITSDQHMQFMRWLYEQGELQDTVI